MALRLAHGHVPAAPIADAKRASVYDERLVHGDGEQEMWHFWLFPLAVAPVMAVVTAVGGPPVLAFAIFNAVLMWVGFVTVRRRHGVFSAVLICLSPIIWWTDKAQVEVFTFVCLLLGFAVLPQLAAASLLFALAATQNPPIGLLVVMLSVVAVRNRRTQSIDLWLWIAAFLLLALHPLYYWTQLGRSTPLVDAIDLRIPGLRAFLTPIVDLNIGFVVHAPLLALTVTASLAATFWSIEHRRQAMFVLATYLIFLFAFSQAPNVNSGGTPGLSRYAVWLIPPLILIVGRSALGRHGRRALGTLAALSAVWSIVHFDPRLPEDYLVPTRLALYVWSEYPALENPLPEIFAERLRHSDEVNTMASTSNCAKALLQSGYWPDPCESAQKLPEACSADGALCYANRTQDGSYAFVRTSRRGGVRFVDLLHLLSLGR
jgi:hypothetical protein